MYTRLGRRADLNRPDGVRTRRQAVDRHRGDYTALLRRHERAAEEAAGQGIEAIHEVARHLFRRVHDTRNLRCAWDYLSADGGQAPGPSGLTYDDLNEAEIWQLCRESRLEIKTEQYRPGPDREVKILKHDGVHYRTLRLQDIEDRVVQRAIVQIVQPLLDPRFSDRSHGFRPSRHRNHALVQAEHLAASEQRWVWLTEDIRDAFEHVPHGRLLQILGRTLPEKVMQLIERIIENGRTRGIRQGAPLSPMLLNCYLDHTLDRKWRKRRPERPADPLCR